MKVFTEERIKKMQYRHISTHKKEENLASFNNMDGP